MTGEAAARPVLGASLACFRDGLVLIARRGRAPNRGLWSLPGGRIEFGETAEAAALRELYEETGVTADLVGFAGVVEAISRDAAGGTESHAVVLAYAGRWRAGEPRVTDEAEAFAWIDPAAVDAYDTTPGLAGAIVRAAEIAA